MDSDEKSLEPTNKNVEGEIIKGAEKEIIEQFTEGGNDAYGRFFLNAISGIPWLLPLSFLANLKGELDQDRMNKALHLLFRENKDKINELIETIYEIKTRLDKFGEDVQKRIESPEYLTLVRRAFRTWGEAETLEKRQMIKQLLTNAGAITLCPDDQIRLFIDWIERYHESHFAVMREVYLHKPITKGQIWDNLHPEGRPRDDSSQAGFFNYLTRELNMGGIIHLERTTNAYGQTMRANRSSTRNHSQPSETLESAFESTKSWVLSELGKEFVRYVMEDVDLQLNKGE